jgi:DNA-binding transcriptional regulator YiaG
MDFSKLFCEARGKLSQSEAAAKIAPGLSVRTVQDWESGRRTPPPWVQWLVLARLKRKK